MIWLLKQFAAFYENYLQKNFEKIVKIFQTILKKLRGILKKSILEISCSFVYQFWKNFDKPW